jgi:histidine ammonia-lyase
VLAIELLTAARGIELRSPLRPSPASAAAIMALRAVGAPAAGADRWLAPEIEFAVELVTTGAVVAAVESVTGSLN